MAQARIVARLRERGHSLDEIRAATESGRLAFGFVDELMPAHERTHTLQAAADDTGLEPALIERVFLSMGFNARSVERLSDDDLELLRHVAVVLAAGFPLVALLQLVRVYGQALAQMADAEVRLFHLYVHEPLMREGVPGVRMGEEMEELARELLPLASPIMDRVHQRFLAHFVEQDVIGHMEADLEGAPLDLGRLRVAIAFADLAGYTRLTEEEGEEEAVDAVERFIEDVEVTLPDDARVIKTIGDEVMIVGSDAAGLVDWAVGFQRLVADRRPLPRIGMHYGPDALPRRRLLRPRGQPGRARGRARRRRRGPRHAPRGRARRAAPRVRAHRRGPPQGLRRAHRAVRRARDGRRWLTTCSSACGPPGCSPPAPTSWSCSPAGATRSACSTSPSELDCSVRALHVNYGLREEAGEDEAHCRALCEQLGVALAVHAATRPDDAPGNLQAWARDVRYAAATEAAGGGLVAVGHTASDQAETVLYRLAASPGRRALLGMRPRSGQLVRPLLTVTREETGAWCRARGLTWRDDVTNASDGFARGRVRHGLLAALEAVDARAAANVVRTAELLREEAEVLDVVVDTALAGRDRIVVALPRRPAAGARAAHRAPPRRGRHREPVRPRGHAPRRHPGPRGGRGAGRRRRRAGGGRGWRAALRGDAAAVGGLRSRGRLCAALTAASREAVSRGCGPSRSSYANQSGSASRNRG